MANAKPVEIGSPEHLDAIARLDAAADAKFKKVSEAYGKTVEFTNVGNSFIGIYEGVESVDTVDKITGELRAVNAYRFTGVDHKPATVWGSYWIEKGMEKVTVGQLVKIEFSGQDQLDGAKKVNNFTVSVAE